MTKQSAMTEESAMITTAAAAPAAPARERSCGNDHPTIQVWNVPHLDAGLEEDNPLMKICRVFVVCMWVELGV